MSQRARISLSGTDPTMVDSVCNQIKGISQRTGVAIRGPVPLPTKKLKVACRKSPDGEGSETYDRWEMRIHKRLIDLDADDLDGCRAWLETCKRTPGCTGIMYTSWRNKYKLLAPFGELVRKGSE